METWGVVFDAILRQDRQGRSQPQAAQQQQQQAPLIAPAKPAPQPRATDRRKQRGPGHLSAGDTVLSGGGAETLG